VVQQGLNERRATARRYHWHCEAVRDFTCEPHTAIVGESSGVIRNLVAREAAPAQQAMLAVAGEHPDRTLHELRSWSAPRHHDVRVEDLDLTRLGAVLAVAYERNLRDFASLLLVERLGPRTLQALALVPEVIHGTPTRFTDPARFSFAHGGKDGHPFPVPLKTYDETIAVLRRGLERAKVGQTDRLDGMRRLDRFVRALEARAATEVDFDAAIAHEHRISPSLDGRTVFDDAMPKTPAQGRLF
jgi:hypothetical protein